MKRVFMLMSLAALLCQIGCTSKKEEKEEKEKFNVTSAVEMDTIIRKDFVSQIRSFRNIELRAQEKGYLEQIFVDEGQFVRKGQLLFRIMPKMYEAEYRKSLAEVNVADIEVQNTKTLADKNVVSPNELAMAKAKLEQAKAAAAIAKLHLSFTEIRAPFDGTIDRIPLKLGSLVDEGELLTSLSDNSQMLVYFNVSEPEYLSYQTNVSKRGDTHVSLQLANNELFTEQGLVETIESEFDSETGNIAFRARFPNPNRLLRHGESGKVVMSFPLKQALIIPQKATYELQDRKYVYIVDKDGKLKARHITIGNSLPDLYIVTGGLEKEDRFLLDGIQKAKEDEKISYNFVQPRNAISDLKLKTE
ncbi:efflux RND transporter periplasmic adaptor subunit [Sphingobacterium thalpophilum]|uniref:Multidrug resistance protein mexA n=1 Tax=Sphingobacterium thalpophilum TaxID=259 RepID=A0A4V6KTV0_9SPHI|nr:efflux RND transporter periplasmic adaptor subunit [Sphingobacterium thalpophilum]VTR50868.1 Multidrug resistance protein mexA precursor [Sphingobacterium thalpophilum]